MKREGAMNPEERLEKAVEAMRNETAPSEAEEAARRRVLDRLLASPEAQCAAFQEMLPSYAEGRLEKDRQWLLEDHLARCAHCRRAFAELRGGPKVVAMPSAHPTLWQRTRGWAVAAGFALVLLAAGRDRIDRMLAPPGPRAVAERAQGAVFGREGAPLAAGAKIADGMLVRTGAGGRLLLRLDDGSRVEVNERSELALAGAWSGTTIQLARGDVIVEAARQKRGTLRVRTRDTEARVRGTVFAVSSGLNGSLVSVVEGSVEVRNAAGQRVLKPGQMAATNVALESSDIRRTVAWSAEADRYLAVLAELASLEPQLTALASVPARTQAAVLGALPRDVVMYVAAPNVGDRMERALALMNERAAQNAGFAEWWNSAETAKLREAVSDLARVSPMLGEETVFTVSLSETGSVPVVLAPVKAGMERTLEAALEEIRASRGVAFVWRIGAGRLTLAATQAHLEWALRTAGQGASSPFAQEIAAHYARGAGWMAAVQPGTRLRQTTGREFPLRYVFFEQRRTAAGDENEMMLGFAGTGAQAPAWLAASGGSAAAEYFSGQAHLVLAASTREPRQIYDELLEQALRVRPEAAAKLAEAEQRLGIRLREDLAGALGTDFAIGIETPTVPTPGWLAVVEVVRPGVLDSSIAKMIDAINASLPAEQASRRLVLTQETAGGRGWKTVRSPGAPTAVTWTYHANFLVAGPDRATVERAIATREGGLTLVQNPAFRTMLPAGTGVHPAGFVWVNVGEALRGLAAGLTNPAVKAILDSRGPALVTFSSDGERIRAASRTSFASLLLDAMMVSGAQSTAEPQAKQARKERHATARR